MKTKKVLLLIILVALSALLISCGSDAKDVKVIPSGFIKLNSGGDYPKNSISYTFERYQILFFDVNGICIYEAKLNKSDFIIKYQDEYYINEDKYLELLELVTGVKVVKSKPQGYVELRAGGNLNNGRLHYMFGKTDISFIDSEGYYLYQTKLSNSDFIVIYQYKFYIYQKKYSELIDITNNIRNNITNAPEIVQIKPEGFIQLKDALSNLKNGLHCMFFEATISIIDADQISIYDTLVYDYAFIVKYENELYVNENTFLELVDIANAVVEQRNKIYSLGEDVALRGGDNDYKNGYSIKINEVEIGVDTATYIIKFVINPAVSDYKMKKIFDHIETDKGTIIKEFTFIGDGEVQVNVPVGEKINIIIVKSPDYDHAIRNIGIQ